MTDLEVAHQRLENHRLRSSESRNPKDVLRHFAAMQAQEFAYAKWSLAQRAPGTTVVDIDRLFAEGILLRTHLVRPTWHFVLADDIRWMLTATAPRVEALNAYQYRQLGLDSTLLTKCQLLFANVLRGGLSLTRPQLAGILKRDGVEASGLRLAYIFMRAELDAVLCSGPVLGKQHTYALLDERAPHGRRGVIREDALIELTRRYFTSRGPATLKDFAAWSSLTTAEARNSLEAISGEFEREVVGDRTYWFKESETKAARPAVDLLQCYDEYIMSYSESRDVLRGQVSIPQQDSTYLHGIFLDGRLIGRWKHVLTKTGCRIAAQLYKPLSSGDKRLLNDAVQRYGTFLGMPATMSCDSITPPKRLAGTPAAP